MSVRPDNLGPEFVYLRVAIDGNASAPEFIFNAWCDPENLWNGFAQPVFELDEARKVVATVNRDSNVTDGPFFVWCNDGTTLVEVHRNYPDETIEHLVTVYRGPTYGISDGWCWQFVDRPPDLRERIYGVVAQRGWSDQSVADLALNWILTRRDAPGFLKHLHDTAEVENGG